MPRIARMQIALTTAAAALALITVTACSSSTKTTTSTPAASTTAASVAPSPTPTPVTGTIVVLAASSLTDAFTTLGKQFETAHPGTTVKFSFAASSALALQINQGAPADVFASAAPTNMQQVITAGSATTSTNFVKNYMEIAVPPTNPKNITTLNDLTNPTVKVALCQPQVPCGATAQTVFTNAKITVTPVTLQPDVKSTLTIIENNEADAGIVYVTDVQAAGTKVKGITIPTTLNASTEYPITTLTKAPNPTGAAAFVTYITSPAALTVLTADGFQNP